MTISHTAQSVTSHASRVSQPDIDVSSKSTGFERNPGGIARLKSMFGKFKADLDTGRTRFTRSTSMSAACAANIRSSTTNLSQRARRHTSPSPKRMQVDTAKQQANERTTQAETLVKETPTFKMQSAAMKADLLGALNACSRGYSDHCNSAETLFLLSVCIQEILKTSAETNGNAGRTNSISTSRQTPVLSSSSQRPAETGGSSRNSGTVNSMTAFLKSILEKCETRQAELAFRNKPIPQVAQASKTAQATQATPMDELDALDQELAGLTNLQNQPSLASASSQVDTSAANGNPQRLSAEQERDEFNELLPDWERMFSAEITAPPRNGNANPPPPSDLPPPPTSVHRQPWQPHTSAHPAPSKLTAPPSDLPPALTPSYRDKKTQ